VMYSDQNRKTCDCDTDRDDSEKEAMLGEIGGEGDNHSESKGTCPRGNAVQLCFDWTIAIGSYDCGGKKRQSHMLVQSFRST